MKQPYYMHIWLVESSMVTVLRKTNFSLLQRNKFYLAVMVVVKHREWLKAFRSQLSEQLKPNNIN